MAERQLWDLDLASFVDRTASADPTPGGGSAAMVSATIGIALVLMALRVSAAKAEDAESFETLIRSGERLREDLASHALADIEVFNGYMAALRLPKRTDEEKEHRRERLAQARIAATEVPLNAAHGALDGLDIARQAVHICETSIVSDVGAGAALLKGALTATLYNVDINLRGLKDLAQRDDYMVSRDRLERSAEERHETVRRVLSTRLGGQA